MTGAYLRAVLHHQGHRKRNRPGIIHGLRHREAEQRDDRHFQQTRAGNHGPVFIPRHTGDGPSPKTEAFSSDAAMAQGEVVLLAEDDPGFLTTCRKMLEKLNYTVLSAGSPGEAVDLAKGHDGVIHLLVTDVVMPRMNGKDLRDEISELRPGIATLFISGYTADVIAPHGILEENTRILNKPFSLNTLAAKLREVLTDA